MYKAKKLLVAIDFSPESRLALEWAIMLGKKERGASITLCHVLSNVIAPMGPEGAFDYFNAMDILEKSAKKQLAKIQGQIPKTIRSSWVLKRGNVAAEIEQLCRREGFDLVVMTTHGRQGLSHMLQGSASEETVRLAPCPVLVLHMNTLIKKIAHTTKA